MHPPCALELENAFNRRAYFRVPYEGTACPIFEIGARTFSVKDLSERGLRLEYAERGKGCPWPLSETITGRLTLPQQRAVLKLSGKLIRISQDHFAIRLDPEFAISLQLMMREQILMIQSMPQYARFAPRPGMRNR